MVRLVILRSICLMDVTLLALLNVLSQVESKNEAADSFLRQLEEDVALAIWNLKKAQEKQEGYAD